MKINYSKYERDWHKIVTASWLVTRSSPNNKLKGLTRPRECIVIVRHTFSCAALSYGKLYGDKHVKNSGQASDMMMAKKNFQKFYTLLEPIHTVWSLVTLFLYIFFHFFFFLIGRNACKIRTRNFFPIFFSSKIPKILLSGDYTQIIIWQLMILQWAHSLLIMNKIIY